MRWDEIPDISEWGAPGHCWLIVHKKDLMNRIVIGRDGISRFSVENHIMGGDPCYGTKKTWRFGSVSIMEGEHIEIEVSPRNDSFEGMDPILTDTSGIEDILVAIQHMATRLLREERVLIVYTFHYSGSSGGISILHYLVHCINSMLPPDSASVAFLCPVLEYPVHGIWYEGITGRGFRATDPSRPLDELSDDDLVDLRTNMAWKTPIISREVLLKRNNIVVYPETVMGNPIEQACVIRWILYFPEEEVVQSWQPKDIKMTYCSVYALPDMPTENYPIFVNISAIFEKTENIPSIRRKGACFTIRKAVSPSLTKFYQLQNVNKNPIIPCDECSSKIHLCKAEGRIGHTPIFHPTPAVRFEYPCTTDEIIKIFKKTRLFYCYDLFTLCNMIAPLCGCVCVIPPIENPRLSDLFKSVPWTRLGIAHGDSAEEIERAEQSLHNIRSELLDYFRGRNILTIYSMLERCL